MRTSAIAAIGVLNAALGAAALAGPQVQVSTSVRINVGGGCAVEPVSCHREPDCREDVEYEWYPAAHGQIALRFRTVYYVGTRCVRVGPWEIRYEVCGPACGHHHVHHYRWNCGYHCSHSFHNPPACDHRGHPYGQYKKSHGSYKYEGHRGHGLDEAHHHHEAKPAAPHGGTRHAPTPEPSVAPRPRPPTPRRAVRPAGATSQANLKVEPMASAPARQATTVATAARLPRAPAPRSVKAPTYKIAATGTVPPRAPRQPLGLKGVRQW